ncbi:ROK family protein [Actinoplanes sp. NPDC023936]|uniref:ROK family protein n=1 Tax=Actinoplanes sp. NPDC023936 TaxID=3154910 RepID=UPI0033C33882
MAFLGIDVGGTKVALRAEDGSAEPYETRFEWPHAATVEQDVAALTRHIAALTRRIPIGAAGVAMPATVAGGRVVSWPGRSSWVGLDLESALPGLVPGARVAYADDGDVAALAEAHRAGVRNLVYLGVGTGIGGGIVLDGTGIPGPGRGSCEVGHIVVTHGGRRCDCGRQGCLQAYASGPATLRRAGAAYPELQAAWRAGRAWAVAAVEETCELLATAAIGIAELVRPDLVVIGGGFADGLAGFVPTVARHAARLARPGHPAPRFAAAAHGGRSSLYGAVLLARSMPG